VIYSSPLKFALYNDGVLQITINERELMHYEQQKISSGEIKAAAAIGQSDAERHGGKEVVDYGEDGLAMYADGSKEEKRVTGDAQIDQGQHGESHSGHSDPMVRGPLSVGMDFSFPFAQHVYGLPEHAAALSLPTSKTGTSGTPGHFNEPYRLYNLDVFEYELDEPMALYGSIPLLVAHGLVEGKGRTTGLFWFNPSETFIDIADGGDSAENAYKQSHWMSESGQIDVFLLPGPNPAAVYDQYTRLTGRQQLPPIFALGYHQCRWNYKDEKDVSTTEGMFEKLDYPMDVMWLDIDHTDGNRYFTWDKNYFQTPLEMMQNLTNHGRKLVTIVDPHLKRDENYYIHTEATKKGLYIKDKDGNDFDGWCWPGQSSYLDFTNPKVRLWWAEQFSLSKYIGTTMDTFTWNDMNEPSVFNGPEVSMNKHNLNIEGIEHREWHNLYGLYMQQATSEGLTLRSAAGSDKDPTINKRPFVLTRSFWAGSQRWGAMWTGDNRAEWSHLKIAAPMLLSINLAGLSFAGSDAGGFFGEPGAELFTRWFQAAAFTPFFRGHAHHDTKRREPWCFGEPYTSIVRTVTMIRYSLLPLWYTAFYEAYTTGQPVMRTMMSEFPDDASTFAMDDQWLVGSSLLVKPATDEGQTKVDVYLPKSSNTDGWYDLNTLQFTPSTAEGVKTTVDAPLGSIPVFIRSGHIISRKMRLRRSAKLMHFDPLTLVIAPSQEGSAQGKLYLDDEDSLAHESIGAYVYRQFSFVNNVLTCQAAKPIHTAISVPSAMYRPPNTVERVEVAGQTKAPKRVVYRSLSVDNTQPGVELVSFYDAGTHSKKHEFMYAYLCI
jgi:alpha 1,3-glucosidase